jgi:hypothetical protein
MHIEGWEMVRESVEMQVNYFSGLFRILTLILTTAGPNSAGTANHELFLVVQVGNDYSFDDQFFVEFFWFHFFPPLILIFKPEKARPSSV